MATDPTLIIETPLMIVPPAALTKASRGRKQVLSGVQNIVNALDEIAEKTSCLPQERVATVDKLLKDLANLKELASETAEKENVHARRCAARLNHLAEIQPERGGSTIAWTKKRLDRLIIDHLLREGLFSVGQVAGN
eukprot:jgi/Botrbrau1/3250/Bobra.174_1s0022.1